MTLSDVPTLHIYIYIYTYDCHNNDNNNNADMVVSLLFLLNACELKRLL